MRLCLLLFFSGIFVANLMAQAVGPTNQDKTNHYADFKTDFQQEQLEASRLAAYERQAQQKIKDLYAYLELAANPDYQHAMRQQAADMAVAMLSKDCTLRGYWLGSKLARFKPEQLCRKLLENQQKNHRFIVNNIKMTRPFDAENKIYKAFAELDWKGSKFAAELQILLQEKNFGSRTEKVWTLKIAAIYPMP